MISPGLRETMVREALRSLTGAHTTSTMMHEKRTRALQLQLRCVGKCLGNVIGSTLPINGCQANIHKICTKLLPATISPCAL